MVFDSISSNMRFSRSIHLLMCLSHLLMPIRKDWLTYSGGTDRPGKLCYNSSISYDLTQMVNLPTRIPDCDSHCPALLDLFISSHTSICSTMTFLWTANSDHVVVSVSTQLPLLVNFVSGFRLELMYVSLIVSISQTSLISMVLSCLCCCHSW